jgi:uncharacterized membrane protein
MACMMDGMMQGGMMGSGMMLLGGLLLLLLLGITAGGVLLVAWLARRTEKSPNATRPTDPPLDILKRRLAQGEITLDEYTSLRHHLQES